MVTQQQLEQALRNAHAAGDTASATKIANALKSMGGQQNTGQPRTDMGTAFQYGDKRLKANSLDYTADLEDRLNDSFLGDFTAFGRENIGNPVREALGLDPLPLRGGDPALQDYRRERAQQLRDEAAALNYQPMTSDDIDGVGSAVQFAGQKIAESAPQMLSTIAMGPLAGGAMNMGIFMPGELNDQLKQIEDLNPNERIELAATGGAIMGALETLGVGALFTGVPKALLGKLGVNGIAKILEKRAGTRVANRFVSGFVSEAGTEGLQEETSMAFERLGGAEISDEDAAFRRKEAIIGGGAAGAGIRAGGQAAVDTATAVKNAATGTNPAQDQEAAADLAARLKRIIEVNNINTKDVDKQSTTGAREAVDKAHIQIAEQIKQQIKELKQRLQIKDSDPEAIVLDKVMAKAGERQARNKTKSTVGADEMDAVQRLVGDTQEGQNLMKLMRESNELTSLHNRGYIGGLSQYTEAIDPLKSSGGYQPGSAIEAPLRMLTTAGGAMLSPTLTATQLAARYGSRGIDAITGRRDDVGRYVRMNEGNQGVQIDNRATNLRKEQQKQEAADKQQRKEARERVKAMHLDILESNTQYPVNSPQQIMSDELGLSPQQLIRALKTLTQDKTYGPAARAAIKSLKQGGKIPNVGLLIKRLQRVMAQKTPPATRDRPIVSGSLAAYEAAQAQAGVQPETAGYVRGMESNQQALGALQDAAAEDSNMTPADAANIATALDKLGQNLGKNPANEAQSILDQVREALGDPSKADEYIAPYVERVNRQQQDPEEDAESQINNMVPARGEGLGVFPKTKKLYQKIDGIEVDQGNYQAGAEDVTDKTYAGARVYIENGRGKLEVDPEEVEAPNPSQGKRWYSNLVRPNLWAWTDNPNNLPQSFIATVEQGGKHYYTMQYEADVPVEMYRKPRGDEPTMRPRGFGRIVPGTQIGTIKLKSSGKEHPIYDTVRINPKPLVNFNKPLLSQNTGEQVSTVFDPAAKTEMGFLPFLRTKTDKKYDHPRKILASSNPKNIDKQLVALDQLLEDHPNTLASPEAFQDYLADAMGKANKDGSVPLIPYRALEMVQDPQIIIDQIGGLTEGQKSLAAEGFSAADLFRAAYLDNDAQPDITGKLLLWGILSRGVSPYVQEGMFLDVVTERGNKQGIGKFINDAADGNFNLNDYSKWVKTVVPKGSAGAGSTHNLNAFGKTLLQKMSVVDPETGVTPMQRLHDLMASDLSGKDVRREFHRLNTGVGINNKVLSFMLLVSGRNDVMVLDRIQFRNMFDDGRFDDFNIYDPTKVDDKQIAGSSIQALGDDTMGLMIYEALERDLAPSVKAAYDALGRSEDFSMGRYHWESWVASSAQEVDHGTISGIINEAMGLPNPYDHITTREGRYNRFDSGAIYGYNPQTGQPYIQLPDGLGNMYEFTPTGAGKVLERIRKKKKSDGIVPKDFSVSESREGPYYERPEVNKENLRKVLIEEGGQLVSGGLRQAGEGDSILSRSVGLGAGGTQPVSGQEPEQGSLFIDNERSQNELIQELRDEALNPKQLRAQYDFVVNRLVDKKPVVVGQPGTPLSAGLQDIGAIKQISKALGYTFHMALNEGDMEAIAAKRGLEPEDVEGNSGFAIFAAGGGRYPADGMKGTIGVLADDERDLPRVVLTALHELGHGIEGAKFDAANHMDALNSRFSKLLPSKGEANEDIFTNSMRFHLARIIEAGLGNKLAKADKKQQQAGKQILDELLDLQRNGRISFANVRGKHDMRPDYEDVRQQIQSLERSVKDGTITKGEMAKIVGPTLEGVKRWEQTYLHSIAELAADGLAVSFVNPTLAKKRYPTLYMMNKALLEQADSAKIIQLNSAPLAAILAVILSAMAVGLIPGAEEEEEGILAPRSGALTI